MARFRYRFTRPEHSYFWSRQSELLIASTFSYCRNLTRLRLPSTNNNLLKTIAIYCGKLQDLEVQFSPDVTDEGLPALAGKSLTATDQGLIRHTWPDALTLTRHFGEVGDWFIKDCMLFTPKQKYRPIQCPEINPLPPLYDTGFGCKMLQRLRVTGDFRFPHLARKHEKQMVRKYGPVLEHGLYALLLSLSHLSCVNMNGFARVLSHFSQAVDRSLLIKPLPLKVLNFDRDLLSQEELDDLGEVCHNVEELKNVSPDCSDDHDEALVGQQTHLRDRSFSRNLCRFLRTARTLKKVSKFEGRLNMSCFNGFLLDHGKFLTKVHLSADILALEELLNFRKHTPCLEILEGTYIMRHDDAFVTMGSRYHSHMEAHRKESTISNQDRVILATACMGQWKDATTELLVRHPWPKLRVVDIEGRLSVRGFPNAGRQC